MNGKLKNPNIGHSIDVQSKNLCILIYLYVKTVVGYGEIDTKYMGSIPFMKLLTQMAYTGVPELKGW